MANDTEDETLFCSHKDSSEIKPVSIQPQMGPGPEFELSE